MFCHLCSGAPRPSADRYGCSRRTTYNTVNDTIHEAPEKVDRHLTVTSHHQYHTLNCVCVCVCACCLQACRSTYKCVHVSHFCLDILAAVCWKAHFKEHNKTFFFFFFFFPIYRRRLLASRSPVGPVNIPNIIIFLLGQIYI